MKKIKINPGDKVVGVYYDSVDLVAYGKGLVDITGHIVIYSKYSVSKIFFESVGEKLFEVDRHTVRYK